MGKLVVTEFMTVDGVFEDPGGAEDLEQGGWAFQFERGADGDEIKRDELMASDALLLGRGTYEGFAAAWPSRDGEFADKFNGMPKYVYSSTLESPEWNNTTVLGSDLAEEVGKLKERYDGDIQVAGSGRLVGLLTDLDLVDLYRLMVFPTLLRGGRRLFDDGAGPRSLRLVAVKPVGNDGILVLDYVPRR
jgi:dihydrofolate reductase